MRSKIIFWILFAVLLAASVYKVKEYQRSSQGSPMLFKDKKRIEMVKRNQLTVDAGFDVAQARGVMPFSQYTHLIEESPFYKLQRKEPEKVVEKQAVAETPPERVVFVYRGMSVVNGRKVVVLDAPSDEEVFFVGVGDDVNGYFVESISEMEVVLFDGDQRLTVKRAE